MGDADRNGAPFNGRQIIPLFGQFTEGRREWKSEEN